MSLLDEPNLPTDPALRRSNVVCMHLAVDRCSLCQQLRWPGCENCDAAICECYGSHLLQP